MRNNFTNPQGGSNPTLKRNHESAKMLAFAFIAIALFFPAILHAQITNYVIYAGNGGTGTGTPPSPGYAVQLASGTSIQNGNIGSKVLITSSGTATITGNFVCDGKITLSNNNSVINGNVTAANTTNATGTIFSAGSNTSIQGNIIVKGNIT